MRHIVALSLQNACNPTRAVSSLVTSVAAGKIKYRETIAEGLQNAPKAFLGLLKGDILGKQLVKLA